MSLLCLGLQKGLEVLENEGDPSGGDIILVSDGRENVGPFIGDVKTDVRNIHDLQNVQ
jgi:hypothetical protein